MATYAVGRIRLDFSAAPEPLIPESGTFLALAFGLGLLAVSRRKS